MSTLDGNLRLAAFGALCLFLMLWLPLGQLEFMTQHWMKVGTYMAPVLLLTGLAASPHRANLADPFFASIVLLMAYIAHQFEEHWVDLLGNTYAFYDYVNELVRTIVAPGDSSVAPLTPMAIYVINTSLVWLVGVIAVLFGRQHRFTVMALAAITLVNGATHIVAGLFTQSYNPGLLTSVILFLPLSLSYFYEILRHDAAARRLIAASLVWALLAHALMVGGLLAANLFGVIPESLYFLLLVLWSALPLMLFRKEINEQTRSQ